MSSLDDIDVRLLVLRWVPSSLYANVALVCRTWHRLVEGCPSLNNRTLLQMRSLYVPHAHLEVAAVVRQRTAQMRAWFDAFWHVYVLLPGEEREFEAPLPHQDDLLLRQLRLEHADIEGEPDAYTSPFALTPCASVALRAACEHALAFAAMHFEGNDQPSLFGSREELHTMWKDGMAYNAVQDLRELNAHWTQLAGIIAVMLMCCQAHCSI